MLGEVSAKVHWPVGVMAASRRNAKTKALVMMHLRSTARPAGRSSALQVQIYTPPMADPPAVAGDQHGPAGRQEGDTTNIQSLGGVKNSQRFQELTNDASKPIDNAEVRHAASNY